VTRANTQARLDQALSRLLAGQPTVTDGVVNVVNLCREAGVGRDSFYRSPQEFKDRFNAAQANSADHQPEVLELRTKLARLKQESKESARRQAATIHDLEETNKTYADHIQALTLANAELAAENQRLRAHINPREGNVMRLPKR
jgi:chromosome segregation ATPase